ncbi:MAG: nucleotidyltransferase family protein [Firmicutes bacterium]|nr:nucleotidyltransferase family protein [Bacillota bacterium]
MRTVGIIAEYHPFHRGHAYQLREARRLGGTEGIVAVMSGNFVQRGEPALVDKHFRAGMAVRGGVDLVLELPTIYAMSGAKSFAEAGVRLLAEAGVDAISFGSECGDAQALAEVADCLQQESASFRERLREGLGRGESFARAREAAVANELGPRAAAILRSSNDILAVEYISALNRLGRRDIEIIPVRRVGASHDELSAERDGYASAAAIRSSLRQSGWTPEELDRLDLPEASARVLAEAHACGMTCPAEDFYTHLLYASLAMMAEGDWERIPETGEGLENRILEQATLYGSVEEIVQRVQCKRYPAARIRRVLMNLMLGITTDLRETCGWPAPPYLRVLGMSDAGAGILADIKAGSNLPVMVNPAADEALLTPEGLALWKHEVRWTDLYHASLVGHKALARGTEYRAKLQKNSKYVDMER